MKAVLVTGNSRGVGLSISEHLLENTDFKVVGLSRSVSKEILALKQRFGSRFVHYVFDLSDAKGVKNFYLSRLKSEGPYYGLVNNAAIAYDDIVTNLDYLSLEKMFHVNVFSAYFLTKYIIRDFLLNGTRGSLVHISSVSASTGYKGLAMYASTKGALEAFSKNVAREWGSVGIRSNCVSPGFMETEMSKSLTDEQREKIYARTSLKKPTDLNSVAATVAFLLMEQSRSITGQVLNVDSGTI